jgi:hypothetical protein
MAGIALAALLTMSAAAPAAVADGHDGVYPPIPQFRDDVACTPEVVAPGGTVTCAPSVPEGIEEISYFYGVHRPLVEGAWDDKPPVWDRRDEDRDESDECCGPDFIEVDAGSGTAPVAADGTVVFSFDIVSDARDGDRYAVVARGKGPGDVCFVYDSVTEEIIGTGALESEDEGGSFVVGGIHYYGEDNRLFFCTDEFGGWGFGLIAEPHGDEQDDEAAARPGPHPTGPSPTLPRTGTSPGLLALLGTVALAGGATAIGASRRLARRGAP